MAVCGVHAQVGAYLGTTEALCGNVVRVDSGFITGLCFFFFFFALDLLLLVLCFLLVLLVFWFQPDCSHYSSPLIIIIKIVLISWMP